jgi:hypothetical protein
MYRGTGYDRCGDPIQLAVHLVRALTTRKEFEAFHVVQVINQDVTLPEAPAHIVEDPPRQRPSEEVPVIMLSEIYQHRAILQTVLNVGAVADVVLAYDLFKWILAGYDERLKGQLDARLQLEKFHLEEFGFNQLGWRPAIKANGVFLLLGDLSQPHHKGYMPNFPW